MPFTGHTQKLLADSIENLLAREMTDTGKVKLMWNLAKVKVTYDPDSALLISRQALFLATKIKYTEGESRSMGQVATAFSKLGNYPKALEYYFAKLKIEENRNNPYNMASVLINIGIVYGLQEEYDDALRYYYQSDSIIRVNNIDELRYYSLVNLGDVYDRMGNNDSAFSYFSKALIIATSQKNDDFMGNSMTGLGHTYLRQKNYPFSLLNYQTAIQHLIVADNDEVLCEAALGLAKLYLETGKPDSARYYATLSLNTARKGFLDKELDATRFMTQLYRNSNNVDSAFYYLDKEKNLNDSINSRSRIREIQAMSSSEKLRQLELEENRKILAQERRQQLQYLFIGIFIPGFFLLTLLLSRIRIHPRVIRILGVLSLLILFEYLTLLLHPRIAILTHHTPVYEMLIFVSIAAFLIPGHHRIERWLIQKLTHRNDGSIRVKKSRLKINRNEDKP